MISRTLKEFGEVACGAIRERFQRYDSLVQRFPGLLQPWAGTSQRFQRSWY